MRKIVILSMVLLLNLVFVAGAISQEYDQILMGQQLATARNMSFEGEVLSHDIVCHCIVVKTSSGNLTLQDDFAKFDQDYNRLKGLRIGSMVKGEYKTVNYINYATWVRYN